MIAFPGLEIMPFEIAKMIITIFSLPGKKTDKDLVPEMILNIPVVMTALINGIQ